MSSISNRSKKSKIKKEQKTASKNAMRLAEAQKKADLAMALKLQEEQRLTLIQNRASAEKIAEDAMKRMKTELRGQVIGELLIMMTMTLHDEFGFGKKRLEQFTRRFADVVDTLEDREICNIDAYSLHQALIEETGFNIEESFKRHDKEIKDCKALGKYVAIPIYENGKSSKKTA